jgi:hypothetical protein
MWTWPPWHLCRSQGTDHFLSDILKSCIYILISQNLELQGAGLIHFQDFNAEVLKCLTIPNVKENLFKESSEGTCTPKSVGFFAGDWSEMDKLLLCGDAKDDKTCDNTKDEMSNGYDIILMAETVYALSSLPNLYKLIKKVNIKNVIFPNIPFLRPNFAESVCFYVENLLQCLHYPGGVVYMAGKKHYFGVGGGTRQFLRLVEEDGKLPICTMQDC